MIITHCANDEITKITEEFGRYNDASWLKGCLFFGQQGNNYSMGDGDYQYDMKVENVINVGQFPRITSCDVEPTKSLLEELKEDLDLDWNLEEVFELLSDDRDIYDYEVGENCGYSLGEASWLIQQYQGILAHKLGYDCAAATDEQGRVYIAYCVGKEDKLELVDYFSDDEEYVEKLWQKN